MFKKTAVWCLFRAVFHRHALFLYLFNTSYFPYNGQNGTRSIKNNGKDNEFEYIFS